MIAVFVLICTISCVLNSNPGRPVVFDTKALSRNKGEILSSVYHLRNLLTGLRAVDERSAMILEMAETNSIESCRSGWHEINNTCYYFPVYWKMDWARALETCEGMGSQLLTLKSDFDEFGLIDELKTVFGEKVADIWVGAVGNMSTDNWIWINGKPINYTVDWDLLLEIGIIHTDLYKCLAWSDGLQVKPCVAQLHFLCQMTKERKENDVVAE